MKTSTLVRPGVMRRSWRGLRNQPPNDTYDVVVIGAGIGGLFCANKLIGEGLRVLLVEQHYMVGGYCSTFRRKGYTFDAASHFYPLLGNPTTITGKFLGELGIDTGWVKMDPVDTFHFPDGTRFEVDADYDTYRRHLDEAFPEERENLNRFFELVRETYMLGLLEYFRGRKTQRLDPYRELTLGEVLHREFKDPKLKLLLTADCPHWGSPPSRISFVFDSMLRLSYFLGNYYPQGGSQTFADDLAQRFEEQGGHILMSTRVDRILVEDGTTPRVRGVAIERVRGKKNGDSQQILAPRVISNADYRLTLEHLLGEPWVPAETLAATKSLKPSFPCFLTHIGLRDVPDDALAEAQGYYWTDWNFDRVGRGALKCKIFVPTLYEPRMAPPGGQIVILQRVQEIDYHGVDDWQGHKQGVEDEIVGHLENVIPGIGEKIVTRSSASAATSQRFTLNRVGAMLGWEMSPDQLGDRRPDVDGLVDGLYCVGHWTRPGGGITPVIVSAMEVAGRVLKEVAVS